MIKSKPSTYRTAIFAEEKEMTQLRAFTRGARLVMYLFAASLLILTLGALPASADTFTFTSCHVTGSACLGGSVPSGFGTVTLTQSTATTVSFDVVLTNGNRFVETGAGGGHPLCIQRHRERLFNHGHYHHAERNRDHPGRLGSNQSTCDNGRRHRHFHCTGLLHDRFGLQRGIHSEHQ
jgi:hypothetical protein